MGSEVLAKKLEQISTLLDQLDQLLRTTFADFQKDLTKIRAAERTFQLIVDLASDVNTQLLLEHGKATPDTYRQSFIEVGKEKIITRALAEKLAVSASLRNILVHEYDFEEDYKRFYDSVTTFIPLYREYIKEMLHRMKR